MLIYNIGVCVYVRGWGGVCVCASVTVHAHDYVCMHYISVHFDVSTNC